MSSFKSTKKTKSFKLPHDIETSMLHRIVADGYGLRGKSRWLCDTISKFLGLNDPEFIIDAVEYADELTNLDRSLSFRPTTEVDSLLDSWLIEVRKRLPALEGVKSKIIRAAIMQELLGAMDCISELQKVEAQSILLGK